MRREYVGRKDVNLCDDCVTDYEQGNTLPVACKRARQAYEMHKRLIKSKI